MEGFLEVPKKGRWRAGNMRYFVVDHDRMGVFSGKDAKTARGGSAKRLPASNFTAVQLTGVTAGEFRILTKRTTYLFRAGDAHEARTWVRAVQGLMDRVAEATGRRKSSGSGRVRTAFGGTKSADSERFGLMVVGAGFSLIAGLLILLTTAISPKQRMVSPLPPPSTQELQDRYADAHEPQADVYEPQAEIDPLPPLDVGRSAGGGGGGGGGGKVVVVLIAAATLVLGALAVYTQRRRISSYIGGERRRLRRAVQRAMDDTTRAILQPFEDLRAWIASAIASTTGMFSFGGGRARSQSHGKTSRRRSRSGRAAPPPIVIPERALGAEQRKALEAQLLASPSFRAASPPPDVQPASASRRTSHRRQPKALPQDGEAASALAAMFANRAGPPLGRGPSNEDPAVESENPRAIRFPRGGDEEEKEDDDDSAEADSGASSSKSSKKHKKDKNHKKKKAKNKKSSKEAKGKAGGKMSRWWGGSASTASTVVQERRASTKRRSVRQRSPAPSMSREEEDYEVIPEPLDEGRGHDPAAGLRAAGPKYAKYAKMMSSGVPEGAVRNALARDGLSEPRGVFDGDEALYSSSHNKDLKKQLKKKSKSAPPEVPTKKRKSLRREVSVIDELRARQASLGLRSSDDEE